MLRYTLLRIAGAIPTLLLVVLLSFLMVHAAPGGPFASDRVLPADVAESIEKHYRLDESLPQQFVRYLGGLLRGDFGPSYRYRDYSVNDLIGQSLPLSLTLGSLAISLAVIVGVSAGIFAARRKNSWLDRLIMTVAMSGISIPVFVIAPLLVLLVAVQLQWLPAGWSGNTGIAHYILPVITLALPQIAYIARLTRASMIDVLSKDYIRTARSQGLAPTRLIRVHALRPAMLPVLSYLAPAIATTMTGSVVIEKVFGIPGLGRWFVDGALNRDYTLVLGCVIVYASLVVFLNLIVDILYGVLDPRVRHR